MDSVTGALSSARDITERKRAEEALRESEEKYRSLFENANEAIFVAQDGKLVFVNPMTVMMTGYSVEELMSRPFIEFIHQDDRDMVIDRHVRRMKGDEIPPLYSFRIIQRDGNIRWVELSTVLINWVGKPATLNFLSDITERKQAEEELQIPSKVSGRRLARPSRSWCPPWRQEIPIQPATRSGLRILPVPLPRRWDFPRRKSRASVWPVPSMTLENYRSLPRYCPSLPNCRTSSFP